MKMIFDSSGFDNLKKKLQAMGKAAEDLQNQNTVTWAELFPAEFMSTHTSSSSIEEFFRAGGFDPNDRESISPKEWDAYIAGSTKFENWEEMQKVAHVERMRRKMGFS